MLKCDKIMNNPPEDKSLSLSIVMPTNEAKRGEILVEWALDRMNGNPDLVKKMRDKLISYWETGSRRYPFTGGPKKVNLSFLMGANVVVNKMLNNDGMLPDNFKDLNLHVPKSAAEEISSFWSNNEVDVPTFGSRNVPAAEASILLFSQLLLSRGTGDSAVNDLVDRAQIDALVKKSHPSTHSELMRLQLWLKKKAILPQLDNDENRFKEVLKQWNLVPRRK